LQWQSFSFIHDKWGAFRFLGEKGDNGAQRAKEERGEPEKSGVKGVVDERSGAGDRGIVRLECRDSGAEFGTNRRSGAETASRVE
jgi:hypothetical protein